MPAQKPTIAGVVVGFLFFFFPYSVYSAASFNPVGIDATNPIIGDSFNVQATANGASPSATYYLKCRIGSAGSTDLTEGQTLNTKTNKWLDDKSTWVDMPEIEIAEDGSWQGSMTCRIKSSALDEAKALFLRACLKTNDSCGSSFQSSNSLVLSPRIPTPTNTPTPTPIPTATNTPTPTSVQTATNTQTPTAVPKISSTFPVTATLTQSALDNAASATGAVLGEETEPKTGQMQPTDLLAEKQPYIIALLFVGIGLAMLAAVYVVKIRLYSKK